MLMTRTAIFKKQPDELKDEGSIGRQAIADTSVSTLKGAGWDGMTTLLENEYDKVKRP